MTITFPRAAPVSGPSQQVFEPQGVDFDTAETGGAAYGVAAGFPRWQAEWTLGTLSQALSDEWRAFLASLKGSQRSFLGFEYGRRFPRAYPGGFAGMTKAGGGDFDGELTSWSQTIGSDGQALVTLNGLPASFALARGDYMDLRWTTLGVERRHLVRMLEAATADGSGVIAGISVEPAIHVLVVPEDAEAHLDEPACVMRLLPETQVTAMGRRKVLGGRVVARQDLRP